MLQMEAEPANSNADPEAESGFPFGIHREAEGLHVGVSHEAIPAEPELPATDPFDENADEEGFGSLMVEAVAHDETRSTGPLGHSLETRNADEESGCLIGSDDQRAG